MFSGKSTILACTLPKLHVAKVLFYADLVGVVISSHDKRFGYIIQSAVAENTMRQANFAALSSIKLDLLPVGSLHL